MPFSLTFIDGGKTPNCKNEVGNISTFSIWYLMAQIIMKRLSGVKAVCSIQGINVIVFSDMPRVKNKQSNRKERPLNFKSKCAGVFLFLYCIQLYLYCWLLKKKRGENVNRRPFIFLNVVGN